MGLHIVLYQSSGARVSEWDTVRQLHDRELEEFILTANGVIRELEEEIHHRPDLTELIEWITLLPSEHRPRYWLLHRLLSENEGYWIYLSR